jgi:hypothetical protein
VKGYGLHAISRAPCLALGQSAGCLALNAASNYYLAPSVRNKHGTHMAPKEPISLPFRWEFTPLRNDSTGAIFWKWRAYGQTGKVVVESKISFETLTECKEDAIKAGYQEPPVGN